MKTETPIFDSTELFVLPGRTIRTSIYERSKKCEEEKQKCLAEIANILTKSSTPATLAEIAATVMVTMGLHSNLTAHSLTVKAFIDRAVFLSEEVKELVCIAKNMQDDALYKLSVKEAIRYGLI